MQLLNSSFVLTTLDSWSLRQLETSKSLSTNWTIKISKELAFAAWLMYVSLLIPPISLTIKPIYRPKTRFPGTTTVTAPARPHHSVGAAAIHHLTATTAAVAHLPRVATAPVVKITVAALHLVMITTPVIAATVLHLHPAQLAHPLTIPIRHPLAAATAMILTALHLVVGMRIRMQPTDMIGLGLDRLRGLMADTMTVPRHQDTGDSPSSSSYSVQEPLMEGSRLS